MAKITGIGGIFFKATDPKALAAWYRDTLGLTVEDWGGVLFNPDPAVLPRTVWSPFAAGTKYFAPSEKPFMINFAVDDLDGFLKDIAAKGVAVLERADHGDMGLFAWILDPDGNKLEFWQPKI
ncbi:MAG TPA: VOC family protein [Rhizomicrobium sp.]|jgi:predicted enzyme related to lactoylglutathione lyase